MKYAQQFLRAVLLTLIVSFGAVHQLRAQPPYACNSDHDGDTYCEGCQICTQQGYELDVFECIGGGSGWYWYHEVWIFSGDQDGWEECDAALQFCNAGNAP
jgi:hypothetical protein